MIWLRKSLLWASVGYLSAATAAAQTLAPRPDAPAVVICRPQPLLEPAAPTITITVAAPRPATVPAIIVRAQMEELPDRLLPSAAEVAAVAKLGNAIPIPDVPLPLTPASTEPSAGAAPVEANRYAAATEPTAPDAWLGLPQSVPQSHPWTGLTVNVPTGTDSVVIYDMGLGAGDGLAANSRFYARADYLLWWTKGYRLPILVTTAPATTPENFRGTLGVPGTVPLFGGNNTSEGPQSGARFTAGYYFDPCGTCGIEGDYFFLGRKPDNFYADSSQYPVLARPFFNVNIGGQDRQLTTTPGLLGTDIFMLRGSITVNNFSDLQGGDIVLRNCLCTDCNYSLYGLFGARFLSLHEGVNITENVLSNTAAAVAVGLPNFAPGNRLVVNDSFATRNLFYGGDVGLDGEYRIGKWFIGARAEVGVGITNETIMINGSQTVTTPAGGRQTFVGGLLAQPSNIGTFAQNHFSVAPQIGLKIGYNLTDNVRVFVGYDFLYWSSVVRPGDQIDTSINVSQVPNFTPVGGGGAFAPPSSIIRPIVPFATSSYLAHGLNAGLEWRY